MQIFRLQIAKTHNLLVPSKPIYGYNILGLLNAPALHLKLYFMRTSVQYILLIHEEKSWAVSRKDEAVATAGSWAGRQVLILTLDCTHDCKVKCILYYLNFFTVFKLSNLHLKIVCDLPNVPAQK